MESYRNKTKMVVRKIQTYFIKELTKAQEVFKKDTQLPIFLQEFIIYIKKIFCIITILENGLCILPYRKIRWKFQRKLITKVILKLNANIVLSNYLEKTPLKQEFEQEQVKLLDGKVLASYLLMEMLTYLAKMQKTEVNKQEVTLLISNYNSHIKNNIITIAKNVKRVQIVTNHVQSFMKLEEELEELGISLIVTNNKRKSLVKAKLIINMDYTKEMLNEFMINRNSIILNIWMNAIINAKSFSGLNIVDYEINYEQKGLNQNIFNRQKVYESKIFGKSKESIQDMIKKDKIQILYLKGKNGILNKNEYLRV